MQLDRMPKAASGSSMQSPLGPGHGCLLPSSPLSKRLLQLVQASLWKLGRGCSCAAQGVSTGHHEGGAMTTSSSSYRHAGLRRNLFRREVGIPPCHTAVPQLHCSRTGSGCEHSERVRVWWGEPHCLLGRGWVPACALWVCIYTKSELQCSVPHSMLSASAPGSARV